MHAETTHQKPQHSLTPYYLPDRQTHGARDHADRPHKARTRAYNAPCIAISAAQAYRYTPKGIINACRAVYSLPDVQQAAVQATTGRTGARRTAVPYQTPTAGAQAATDRHTRHRATAQHTIRQHAAGRATDHTQPPQDINRISSHTSAQRAAGQPYTPHRASHQHNKAIQGKRDHDRALFSLP